MSAPVFGITWRGWIASPKDWISLKDYPMRIIHVTDRPFPPQPDQGGVPQSLASLVHAQREREYNNEIRTAGTSSLPMCIGRSVAKTVLAICIRLHRCKRRKLFTFTF